MQTKGFIKNIHLLEEQYRDRDLLGLHEEIKIFSHKLDHFPGGSIFGLIGGFGTGKSNFLKQVQQKYEEGGDCKWFEFDAWKYPDRNHLWESFVLEIAEQRGLLQKILNRIDGGEHWKKIMKALINVLTGGVSKDMLDVLILSSPAKRTFQIQKILNELLNNVEQQNIYIIIEDIDRSGDSGVYFLETLNYFFKNDFNSEKSVKVVVPISDVGYEENKNLYLKCIDVTHFFSIGNKELRIFLEHIIDEEVLNERTTEMLVRFLQNAWKHLKNELNMRLLKKIIRGADGQFITLRKTLGDWIDWRMVLLFELAKHTKSPHHTQGQKNVENLLGNSNSFLRILLDEIIRERTPATIDYSRLYSIEKFTRNETTNNDIKIEVNADDKIEKVYILSDYYDN